MITEMDGIAGALILGLVIGLSGALAPGPTLVATIRGALSEGWAAGPKIAAGHAALETAVFLAVVAGLGIAADPVGPAVALVGGAALVVFGTMTIRESRKAVLEAAPGGAAAGNPYVAGAVTSAANPYFWIWWLTIGAGLLLDGLAGGLAVAGAFMIGHWAADFGWFGLVAAATAGGRRVMSVGQYRLVLAACGVFLILFGASYLWQAFA
ncbi:LysE family translocator [uncultured Methanofollis sp.]|uniref:LysE family translocator n=1 Tax=uncultured Methanofollis sp. TaxID=262500 RepID=UPI002628EA10|nr:LysE family transporter [uncultured Methanofollis sp.]